ncbi:hypothetical protein BJ944DRAFT_245354 [Cunninghamella echinulata]|nr:hypothetical protein BJ944DRAFT_245354 [Cunninghamella echinulata]
MQTYKKNDLLSPQRLFVLLCIYIQHSNAQMEKDLVEELTIDEWPIEEEEEDIDQSTKYTIYEDTTDTMIDQVIEEEEEGEEEEDDVDNDDYNEEDEEENTTNEDDTNNQDMNDNDNNEDDDMMMMMVQENEATNDMDNIDDILNKNDNIEETYQPFIIKATSPLQQQEEQVLNEMDQHIISTLENAIDTIKQDKPLRAVPIQFPSTSSSYSIYVYWIIGLLCMTLFFYIWQNKKQAFRDQLLPTHDKKKRVKKEWI